MAIIKHGVRVLERTDTEGYIQTIESATAAIIVTADDADAAKIPLLTPVKFAGFDEETLIACGITGTLSRVIDAIGSQGYAPLMAVIRVADDADPLVLKANVEAGIAKIAEVSPTFDFTPRILAAPGLDAHADVVSALSAMAKKIKAYAYVGLEAVTNDDALLAATEGQYNADEVMPLWPDFTKSGVRVWSSAVAIGLRARIDNDHPQSYAKTISNVSVKGVDGSTATVSWDIQGSAGTDASELNNLNVTTLVKHSGAWRFWGNRSGSGKFESSARIRNVMDMMIANAQLARADEPMSQALIEDIVEDVAATVRSNVRNRLLINGSVWLDPGWNNASEIGQGAIYVHYDFTPPPPLESITLVSVETGQYLLEALPAWLESNSGTETPIQLEE